MPNLRNGNEGGLAIYSQIDRQYNVVVLVPYIGERVNT